MRRCGRLEATTLVLGQCDISVGDITIGARSVVKRSLLDGCGGLEIGHDVSGDHTTILAAEHNLDDENFSTGYRAVVIERYVVIPDATVLAWSTSRIWCGAGGGVVVARGLTPMTIGAEKPAHAIHQRLAVHTSADFSVHERLRRALLVVCARGFLQRYMPPEKLLNKRCRA